MPAPPARPKSPIAPTVPTPAPTPIYIYDMAESGGLHTKLFWGDGELEGENPQDFFNSVELTFFGRPGITEVEKLRSFELRLKSGRAAKTWWTGLAAEKKDTWEHLREAFEEKWPEKVITEKTKEEQHAALAAAVLREEDLGKRVKKDGVEEFSHVVWADKVQRLASALKDDSGLLIPMVRKSMPRSLKHLVGTQHTDWTSFCTAVRAVSITALEERLEVEEEARAIQATIARLEQLQLRLPSRAASSQAPAPAAALRAPAGWKLQLSRILHSHPLLHSTVQTQSASRMSSVWLCRFIQTPQQVGRHIRHR